MSGFSTSEAREVLARTPEVLERLLGQVSRGWTHAAPAGAWTPAKILAHLIRGEEANWIPRARIILEVGESRPFDPFDREGRAEEAERPVEELLSELSRLREETWPSSTPSGWTSTRSLAGERTRSWGRSRWSS